VRDQEHVRRTSTERTSRDSFYFIHSDAPGATITIATCYGDSGSGRSTCFWYKRNVRIRPWKHVNVK
jgi:hypothetical protein